jgi:hypothetical protein
MVLDDFPQSNQICIDANGGGGSGNQAPTIGGNPQSSLSVGQPYDFTPIASDPDGDALQFSANNLPSWASINASNGRITGTPAAGDVGTWNNIRISVSDGSASDELGPFFIDVVATGTASVNVSWAPPTEREDGTPLNGLAGYRVYVGRSPDTLDRMVEVQNGGISSYTVDGLTSGTWYLAVKAFDSDGLASRLSSIVPASVN